MPCASGWGRAVFGLVALQCAAGALELTPDNWDKHVWGKTLFVKFFAPWCGHCKKLKPDWSKLAVDFNGSQAALVAEVDCTGKGKPLCEDHNVTGYPKLMWGRAHELQAYNGARDYESLRRFAGDHLGSSCGPNDLGLCGPERKALFEKFMRFSPEQLDAKIEIAEKQLRRAEQAWVAVEQNMSKQLEKAEKHRDKQIRRIKKKHHLLEGPPSAASHELTPDNWEKSVSGRTVFIKFFAPSCGHCKAIKGDWDRLMADYQGTAKALVAEVDCTGKGQPLCEAHEVTGFPRLLWGSPPEKLVMYTGARAYADFKQFAEDHLGATCGSGDLEACDDAHRSSMETLSRMTPEMREEKVKEANREIDRVTKAFEDKHWNILLQLDLAEQDKNNKTKTIRDQGLAEAKHVQTWNKKQPPGFWKPPADAVKKPRSILDSLQEEAWDVAGLRLPVAPVLAFVLSVIVIGVITRTGKKEKPSESEWCDLRHILMESEDDLLKAKARIDAGESFPDVAKACSTCPSKEEGGSLGRRTKGNITQPELKKVCFDPAMQVGQVIGPVKTQFGFHLLLIESRHGVEEADPSPDNGTKKQQ